MAVGPIFLTFVALETGLKLMTFQGDSGVIPDPETEPGWGVIGLSPGASNKQSRIPET